LLDRLDVHVSLPPVELAQLRSQEPAESSRCVRERVLAARLIQERRCQQGLCRGRTNSGLLPGEFARVLGLGVDAQALLDKASGQLGLSARGFGKVLRVARTVADLAAVPRISAQHIAEALHGRLLDREL
jgi:magnesium chelatase family protein